MMLWTETAETTRPVDRREAALTKSGIDAQEGDEYGEEEDEEEEEEEEDELRQAARAGILLLEKNQELKTENAALRMHVKALESERPGMQEELQKRASEIERLREERRQSLLEVNALRAQQRAQSTLVTDLMDREQRLKEEYQEAEDARHQAEFEVTHLQAEYNELLTKHSEQPQGSKPKDAYIVTNPAATYDSNQSSTFTLSDYEDLVQRSQRKSEENEMLLREMKSLRKDLDAMKRKANMLDELQPQVERLEKKVHKLQHTNDMLQHELEEERAIADSQRSMMEVYKKIADARPFSMDCTCPIHPVSEGEWGTSLQEQLVETNSRLEKELRELRAQCSVDPDDAPGSDDSTDNNSSNNNPDEVPDDVELYLPMGVGAAVASDFEAKKVQELQEKLMAMKESLRHAKQQWQAAIASQKALEECNRAADAEITRLTQALDHQVASLTEKAKGEANDDAIITRSSRSAGFGDEDDDEKWTEETAPYPAPPGDLNSPLIKCLLDHWTADKSKVMHLTDWLHHAIRGTGKPRPLRLEHLSSEVAAGFTQLLVPILRERHGVSVSIYRRESIQILTDMVLQAHPPTQPAASPSIFSTLAAKFAEVLAPTPSASGAEASSSPDVARRSHLARTNSSGSLGSSESGSSTNRTRQRRQESARPMSETDFLYG